MINVVFQILSGEARENVINNIHEYLHDLAARARAKEVELEQFVITKGLNKSPKEYPDSKGQPHLQVALAMLQANIPVNVGDHIPYVICKSVRCGVVCICYYLPTSLCCWFKLFRIKTSLLHNELTIQTTFGVVKGNWRLTLSGTWHSRFYHQSLDCVNPLMERRKVF